jgi:hypothetical protein
VTDRLEHVQAAIAALEWPEDDPLCVDTPHGTVYVTDLAVQDGVVEVTVSCPSGGDPHFRIINPPTCVIEDDGAITDDPIRAVAEAVARYGGAAR